MRFLILAQYCALVLLSSTLALAELKPESVVVLANANSIDSIAVANHYINKRKLTKNHLIKLSIPVEETISRKNFDEVVVPTIRKQLESRNLAASTRVIVSTFDIPIRVASPDSDSVFQTRKIDALRRRDLARASLFNELQNLKKLAGQKPVGQDEIKSDDQLKSMLEQAVRSLLSSAPAAMDPAKFTQYMSNAIQRIAGAAGLSSIIRPNNNNESATKFLEQQRQIVSQVGKQLQSLEQLGASKHRDIVYQATSFIFGGVGVLSRANAELQVLQFTDADASFDSELSLLWWDADMYPLSKRLPNPWFLKSDKRNIAMPIMMVSRIDGPTKQTAIAMIDGALAAEKSGLKGKVFVDARGMKTPGDQYFTMDSLLRDFGWNVRNESDYSVYIEDHEDLLTKAENVAIYVGWYSVGKFVGDFKFNSGAMGYHIASSEAISVRDPENTGWCKNLLARGVVATLGPVDEPYLDSFPAPGNLFGLMMTGKYTLVESYYLSTKYLSWRMVLFGDPLYNPWRKSPAMDFEDLQLPKDSQTPEPGSFDMAASYARRAELDKQRSNVANSLKIFLDRNMKQQ